MLRDDALQLVGLRPLEKTVHLAAFAHFLAPSDPEDMSHDQGWMTSAAPSPELGHSIGRGFLKRDLHSEELHAFRPIRDQDMRVEVCSPHHIDPETNRQHG